MTIRTLRQWSAPRPRAQQYTNSKGKLCTAAPEDGRTPRLFGIASVAAKLFAGQHSAVSEATHNQDCAFIRETIRLAREHMKAGHGGPFAALVVQEGKIVASGWNQVTSTNDPTAHAEMVAIRAAAKRLSSFRLSECVLYSNCEPCPMCLAAAYWARMDRVVFAGCRTDAADAGFDDAALYRELSLPLAERRMPIEQVLREECLPVFEEWKAQPDRVLY